MYGRIGGLSLALEHQHSDGTWGRLEMVPHDSAEHDPERDWAKGQVIYSCTTCEETVRVTLEDEPPDMPRV